MKSEQRKKPRAIANHRTGLAMVDIKSPRLIYLKGVLFLLCGIFAASLLMYFAPSIAIGVLLAITVWSFCRAYYFAFYVIEHYVDDDFRYAGLLDFCGYACKQRLGWRRRENNDGELQ